MIVQVPHSMIADPNDPPASIYPFRSSDSFLGSFVLLRGNNVQGSHHILIVSWHLREDMNEQLADQVYLMDNNHDPVHVTLFLSLHQVLSHSGMVEPSNYQVTVCVMTH